MITTNTIVVGYTQKEIRKFNGFSTKIYIKRRPWCSKTGTEGPKKSYKESQKQIAKLQK